MKCGNFPIVIGNNNQINGSIGPPGPPGIDNNIGNRLVPFCSGGTADSIILNVAFMSPITFSDANGVTPFADPFNASIPSNRNFYFAYADPDPGNISALAATFTNKITIPVDAAAFTVTFRIYRAIGSSNIFSGTAAMASTPQIPGGQAAFSTFSASSSTFAPVPVNFGDRLVLFVYTTYQPVSTQVFYTASGGINIQ